MAPFDTLPCAAQGNDAAPCAAILPFGTKDSVAVLFRPFLRWVTAIMRTHQGEVCHGHLHRKRLCVQCSGRLSAAVWRGATGGADSRAEKTFARRGGRRYLCGSAALFAERRRFVAAWARFDGRGGVSRQWAGGQADAAVFPCLVRPRWRGDALRAESGVDGAPCARRGDSRPAVGRLPDRGGDVVFAAFRRVPLRRGADRERDGGCGHRLSRKNGPRAAAARHGQHAL